MSNTVVAAFTTAKARLHLLSYLVVDNEYLKINLKAQAEI